MITVLSDFVRTSGSPTWRLAAGQVLEELERLSGPDAINAPEPMHLSGQCLGIGTNHQRSPLHLAGALLMFGLAALYLVRVVLPSRFADGGGLLAGYSVLFLFFVLGSGLLLLFAKAPGPDSVLVVGPHGGYAAWRSGLRLWPRGVELSWTDTALRFQFQTVTRYNADVHHVRVYREARRSHLRRSLLFATHVDDAAREHWLRFAAEVPSITEAPGAA